MRQFYLLFCLLFASVGLFAQEQNVLLNYQAVARNASGQVIPNSSLTVRVGFTSVSAEGEMYYSEKHQVQTDDNGYFKLDLGAGDEKQGDYASIPWGEHPIWVNTEMLVDQPSPQVIKTSQALLSVPYAMYAKTAQQLVGNKEIESRNHSIYWLTGGNRETRPPIHFIGTRDNQEFVIRTNNISTLNLKQNGQTQIIGRVTGSDGNKASYPLTVKAPRQGIWIEINESKTISASDNNYVTFEDREGIQGRIEGQSVAEFLSDPFFLIQQAANIAEGVKLGLTIFQNVTQGATDIAAGVASIASLFFAWQAPGWFTSSAGEFVQVAPAVIESIALAANVAATTAIKIRDIGVQYSSGSEDYAEYLERFAVEQDMLPGEIVAVEGGKLTRNTQSARMLKVISFAPAVTGNMPHPDVESLYEKVAFLGQVPVRITGGAKAGDYILPSGKNDGMGIAIPPEDMTIPQYGQIVGVAWEDVPEQPFQLVKTGVGMNRNELAPKVADLSQRVDHILNYLEGKGPLHPEKELSAYLSDYQQGTQLEMLWTNEEFDQMVDARADILLATYRQMEEEMPEKAAYLEQIPGYKAFMDDPVQGLKDLRREPSLASYWAQIDRLVQQQSENNNN